MQDTLYPDTIHKEIQTDNPIFWYNSEGLKLADNPIFM